MTEQASSTDTDLFGAPVTQIRERWGRRSFAKNKENQQLVVTLRAAGWSQTRIAGYMECDEKTLRKHFSRELEMGADIVEAETLQVLYAQMRQGKSTAINKLLDVLDNGRAAPPMPKKSSEEDEKIGKKEALTRAAATPTNGWGKVLQ